MATYKCNICGGRFDFDASAVTIKCEYCGNSITLVDEERLEEIQRESYETAKQQEIENKQDEENYLQALQYMQKDNDILSLKAAIKYFYMAHDYKDSREYIQKCEEKINQIKKDSEKKHGRNNALATIGVMFLLGVVVWLCLKFFG